MLDSQKILACYKQYGLFQTLKLITDTLADNKHHLAPNTLAYFNHTKVQIQIA
jgi:hypothetical protein